MFKKILKISGWLILGVFLAFTLSFTSNEVSHIKCKNIEVLFDGTQTISIGKEEILNLVNAADNEIIDKEFREINCEEIEKEVEKNKAILNAEVFRIFSGDTINYKGTLAVKIKHRIPVLRVMSENNDYFLDKEKVQIPVSTKYTANVLVATGKISSEYAINDLLPFVLYLNNEDFWKAQIEQIHVSENHELTLVPLVGGHLIEFGTVDNFGEKLNNLKTFYSEVLTKNKWNYYSTINLKFKNQVIGTKK